MTSWVSLEIHKKIKIACLVFYELFELELVILGLNIVAALSFQEDFNDAGIVFLRVSLKCQTCKAAWR